MRDIMDYFLIFAYLFFIGSISGWIIEVFFRKFFSSANPEHRWINPGFCSGPYLPIYGFGLCFLYPLASISDRYGINDTLQGHLIFLLVVAACMTLIEYVGGITLLRHANLRLWDYSKLWGNIEGVICPLFSFFWMILGEIYYLLFHPHILIAIRWLKDNLAFSFFIGLFFGVFIIDYVNATQIVSKIKQYAKERGLIVRYENLKMHIRENREQASKTLQFLFPFHTKRSITELLEEAHDALENRLNNHSKTDQEPSKEDVN